MRRPRLTIGLRTLQFHVYRQINGSAATDAIGCSIGTFVQSNTFRHRPKERLELHVEGSQREVSPYQRHLNIRQDAVLAAWAKPVQDEVRGDQPT